MKAVQEREALDRAQGDEGRRVGDNDHVRDELLGVGRDVELFGVSADAVDVGDPRHRLELGPDDPVLNRPELHLGVGLPLGVEGVGLRLDGPEEDLSQAGRDRPIVGSIPGGSLPFTSWMRSLMSCRPK